MPGHAVLLKWRVFLSASDCRSAKAGASLPCAPLATASSLMDASTVLIAVICGKKDRNPFTRSVGKTN